MGIHTTIVIFTPSADESNYYDLRPEQFYDFADSVRKKEKR